MTSELKQQYTLKITQANKTQLVVILYEMVQLYVQEARAYYNSREKASFEEAIRKAKGCLNELTSSLHFEYEPAKALLQLYVYAKRELTQAEVRFETEPLDHVDMVIQKLHDAYETVSKQDTSEPVMANTQSVYAGLTYGKSALTENLSDQSINRGFRV